MARALFGLLVAAALGVTGYYTYSYVNHEDSYSRSGTAVGVKRSCCTVTIPTTCCSESGECTGECTKVAEDGAKCCEGNKEENKEKKDEPK